MMQYVLTPYSNNQQEWAYWENAFTESQLNSLQNMASNPTSIAQVGGGVGGVVDNNIRRSGLNWLPNKPEYEWVFDTLGHVISSLNAQFFRFDLTGFGEHIQLTHYDSQNEGMYGWHVDHGMNSSSPCRKLSLVLQLTDPSQYEGGNLEIQPHGNNIIKMKKQRGLVVVFPSWTLHQVTPVTAGTRQSLVAWITGPAFK